MIKINLGDLNYNSIIMDLDNIMINVYYFEARTSDEKIHFKVMRSVRIWSRLMSLSDQTHSKLDMGNIR